MRLSGVLAVWLLLLATDALGQLVVAPRRPGQSRVRHTVFDWYQLDIATKPFGFPPTFSRIDDRCPSDGTPSPGVRLYFYEAERGVAERAAPRIEVVYRELACRFGHVPGRTLPYVLYSSYREFPPRICSRCRRGSSE